MQYDSSYLEHYGTPRHSGRYPWGSGDNPYQRDTSFMSQVDAYRKKGMKNIDIAKAMGMNTSQFRAKISMAESEIRRYEASEALRLYNKGMTKTGIAMRMGKSEGYIRNLLNPTMKQRSELTRKNAEVLKDAVDKQGYIDVGRGVEQYLGISDTRLKTAVKALQDEGYVLYNNLQVRQLGTDKYTTMRVLCRPGTEFAELSANRSKIKMPVDIYTEEGQLRKREPPTSVDSSRLSIVYAEDGGTDRDGLIELRRGVQDLNLGKARYAQVRIAVDDKLYLKGMAVYSDDLPEGADIRFNTNKHKGTALGDVLKPMKDDPDNPFGASIKDDDQLIKCQRHYIDKDGNEKLSALNIVSEEGTWNTWSKTLASQFLSKQSPSLAKSQLDETYQRAKDELDNIMSLNNPTVRAKLLEEFADQCDSDATDLHAAALPRQSTKVLLPVPEIKEGEAYVPGYRDGETVALVRYPHAGTFEIPMVTVNNKQKNGKSVVGNAEDAIGVNPHTAAQLSGADFDGDTVLVIPADNIKIRSKPYLSGLKDFDAKEMYPGYEGMPKMTDREKGLEMGKVSNLITDMTIKGATEDEICKAVKHSMVVIDAKKHYLDYKRSEVENGIAELKEKYQGGANKGASTLLSRSTSEVRLPDRAEVLWESKLTDEERADWNAGKKVYRETGRRVSKRVKDEDGNTIGWTKVDATSKVENMKLVDDAYELVSGGSKESTTRIERVYAEYANKMKALALEARKKSRTTEDISYSPSANKTYSKEVEELEAALKIAKRNAPLERQAQIIARENYRAKVKANPELDTEHLKRLRGQELDYARKLVGAKKQTINVTEKQWEAINAGAITKSKLKEIIDNSDTARIKQLATPKTRATMSAAKIQRAKSMLAKGYTQADVADVLGVSVSTMMKAIS